PRVRDGEAAAVLGMEWAVGAKRFGICRERLHAHFALQPVCTNDGTKKHISRHRNLTLSSPAIIARHARDVREGDPGVEDRSVLNAWVPFPSRSLRFARPGMTEIFTREHHAKLRGGFAGCGGSSGSALLRLLLRLGLFRVVLLKRLYQARIGEEAMHAIGRGRALRHPFLCLFEVELEAIGMILRQQWIVEADLLDKAAIAGAARIRNHDVVVRALLRAAARQSDLQSHIMFLSVFRIVSRGDAEFPVVETGMLSIDGFRALRAPIFSPRLRVSAYQSFHASKTRRQFWHAAPHQSGKTGRQF